MELSKQKSSKKWFIATLLLISLLFLVYSTTIKDKSSNLRLVGEVDGQWIVVPTKKRAFASIAFGNGKFVAVGDDLIALSEDGQSWTFPLDRELQDRTIDSLTAVAYGNSKFVAVGINGTSYSSVDGSIWTKTTTNIVRNLYSMG